MAMTCPECSHTESKVSRIVGNARERKCLKCGHVQKTRELNEDTVKALVQWIDNHNRLWKAVANAGRLLGVPNLPDYPQAPLSFPEELGAHVVDAHMYETVQRLAECPEDARKYWFDTMRGGVRGW